MSVENSQLCLPCDGPQSGGGEQRGAAGLVPSTGKSKRAMSRKNRVYVLRNFLLSQFPEHMTPESTILDVAGGKGDLSWLLSNADGLCPVVVDPRTAKHCHLIKSVDYLLDHPKEAALRAIPGLDTHQPLAALIPRLRQVRDESDDFNVPKHLRVHLDDRLVMAVKRARSVTFKNELTPSPSAHASWNSFWAEASAQAEASKPLGYTELGADSPGRITDAASALHVILDTRLIVGFHPDQATDACIDLALELGCSYAVVPCCVFPSEFPDRRTEDGDKVRTYDDFIAYLRRKDPLMEVTTLEFHKASNARNIVLYRNVERTCLTS